MRIRVVLALLFALPAVMAGREPATTGSTLLRPARVFDAVSAQPHEGWVVLVTGTTIAAAGPSSEVRVPAGTVTIDLPGTTLLPGLIDAHSHIFLHPYNETLWNDQVLKEPAAYRTIAATLHCERTLKAGFTTLRDLGTEGAGYADVSVQRAIAEGRIPGPRLFVATLAIVATASYGPGPSGFAPGLLLPRGALEATGPAEVVRAVREQIGHGADWVKVYADYGRGPGGVATPTFSPEELKALVEEAHSAGRPVAAHATTAEGMRRAVLAGVQTIRARVRRDRRGLPDDGRAGRGLLRHSGHRGGLLGIFRWLHARWAAVARDGTCASRVPDRLEGWRHHWPRQRRGGLPSR